MRLVAVMAVATWFCACAGHHLVPSPSPSPSSPASPPGGYAIVVTEQDRTATVRVGHTLLLELHAKSSMTDWNGVRSSDTSVLMPLTIDVMVPRGVTLADFKAVSKGKVTVTAVAGALCPPGQACPALGVLYSLRVTVVPG